MSGERNLTGTASLLVAAVAVGFLTWRREFGEIAAGAILLVSGGVLVFCLVWYLRYEVRADATRRGRTFYRVGEVAFWIAIAVIPCLLAWLVAGRLGNALSLE